MAGTGSQLMKANDSPPTSRARSTRRGAVLLSGASKNQQEGAAGTSRRRVRPRVVDVGDRLPGGVLVCFGRPRAHHGGDNEPTRGVYVQVLGGHHGKRHNYYNAAPPHAVVLVAPRFVLYATWFLTACATMDVVHAPRVDQHNWCGYAGLRHRLPQR